MTKVYDQREDLYRAGGFNPAKRQVERNKLSGFNPHKVKAAKRWSHQDLLDSLRGQKIVYSLLDEGPKTATLFEADQFTILVGDSLESAVCVYKSALTYFQKVA